MKLDKIKFAQLIGYLSRCGFYAGANEIQDMDNIIDIAEPVQEPYRVDVESINTLLEHMKNAHSQLIPAIKAYRAVTGEGLLEAKTAVERYRVTPMTKEVLVKKLNSPMHTYTSEHYNVIANFIESFNLPYGG